MRSLSCSRVSQRLQTNDNAQGRYSLERMSALHEYCERTSLWHVALVVVLTIVPALASIVMLDALRLQDPAVAWDENPTFWLRVILGTLMLSFGAMLQLRALVPAASLTLVHCFSVSVLAGSVFTGCSVLLAKCWVFPVPFLMVVCNLPWSLTLFGATLVAIGKRKLAARPEIKAQLQRFSTYINLISTFLVIYPVYNLVFRSLDGAQQLAFLLLLPLIKFALKKATIAIVADVEDTVFVIAIAVDMFNALFQAKCMQSSGSTLTTAGIIAIDVVQNVYSLARLTRSAQSSALVKSTLELLWRCERVLLVEYVEFSIPLLYGASMSALYYLPNARYYPGVVEMTPERLWSTVTNILVYSALEFLSLVYLHVFLKWSFNVSIAHQLAFVLTTERAIVQGIFVSWTIVVLSFTLEHYGNDLTLEFAWVRAARSHSN